MKARTVRQIPVKGRRISPEAVSDHDMFNVARPALDLWLAARLLSGMAPKAVVIASGGAMSLRTAYRWKRALLGLEEVQINGFSAIYAIRRDQPPARLTVWSKVAA